MLGVALAGSLAAVWMFLPDRGPETAIDLIPPRQRQAAATAPPPEAPRAGEQPPSPPAANADGLRLHGITATGAIIGYQSGVQRLVRLGRDVLPGLALQELRQHHVLLASSAGPIELGFSGPARAPQAPADAAAAAAPPASAGEARRDEILNYRFGLAARRSDGRITGFAIRPNADLPVLRNAGLRPGDVLVAVNGQSFDSQEKVQELAAEIAGSFTAEFEFERAGQRMRRSLEVNPRN